MITVAELENDGWKDRLDEKFIAILLIIVKDDAERRLKL
jgi:hypothetical protein